MNADARPEVVVTIPTYRRPHLLPTLVGAIRTELKSAPSWPARIVVVDNDPARSAEETTRDLGVGYAPEARAGIAHARRRALAQGDPDALVIMLDDDVVPEQGWYRGLVDVWESTRPAAVMGFVRYVWPPDTLPWIAAGGFMRRKPHATGERLTSLATGNVLIDTSQVRALGVDFDTSMGFHGGEDTLFGMQIHARGGVIVASADSVVRDDVPLERTTPAFVTRRAMSHGETRVVVDLHGRRGAALAAGRVWMLGGGIVRLAVFSGLHLLGRARGDVARASDARRRIWFALGRIRGSLGVRHAEYSRNDGASTLDP